MCGRLRRRRKATGPGSGTGGCGGSSGAPGEAFSPRPNATWNFREEMRPTLHTRIYPTPLSLFPLSLSLLSLLSVSCTTGAPPLPLRSSDAEHDSRFWCNPPPRCRLRGVEVAAAERGSSNPPPQPRCRPASSSGKRRRRREREAGEVDGPTHIHTLHHSHTLLSLPTMSSLRGPACPSHSSFTSSGRSSRSRRQGDGSFWPPCCIVVLWVQRGATKNNNNNNFGSRTSMGKLRGAYTARYTF